MQCIWFALLNLRRADPGEHMQVGESDIWHSAFGNLLKQTINGFFQAENWGKLSLSIHFSIDFVGALESVSAVVL